MLQRLLPKIQQLPRLTSGLSDDNADLNHRLMVENLEATLHLAKYLDREIICDGWAEIYHRVHTKASAQSHTEMLQ